MVTKLDISRRFPQGELASEYKSVISDSHPCIIPSGTAIGAGIGGALPVVALILLIGLIIASIFATEGRSAEGALDLLRDIFSAKGLKFLGKVIGFGAAGGAALGLVGSTLWVIGSNLRAYRFERSTIDEAKYVQKEEEFARNQIIEKQHQAEERAKQKQIDAAERQLT